MTQHARRLDAFGLDPVSIPWTTQGRSYGLPTLLAIWAMAHPCLLAARFLLSARPPDLLQFVRSMSGRKRPPRHVRQGEQDLSQDDVSTPTHGSRPINVPDSTPRPWSATDIPSSSALTIEQGRLDMWPVVFDHIMQLLGRSYRFVLTRSTAIATRSLSRHYVRFTCRGQ